MKLHEIEGRGGNVIKFYINFLWEQLPVAKKSRPIALSHHRGWKPLPQPKSTAEEVAGTDVITIEGFYGQVADTLRRAWIAENISQCGYCQPGEIMTRTAL